MEKVTFYIHPFQFIFEVNDIQYICKNKTFVNMIWNYDLTSKIKSNEITLTNRGEFKVSLELSYKEVMTMINCSQALTL